MKICDDKVLYDACDVDNTAPQFVTIDVLND